MARRFALDEPSPATAAGSHAAHVRVTAACAHCHRDALLDLATLVTAGHGRTALHDLPLRCEPCGQRGHGIIVDGSRLTRPLG